MPGSGLGVSIHQSPHGSPERYRHAALAVIISISLGIAANTTVFSLTNALLFGSLPVEDPGRLVNIGPHGKSWVEYSEFREQASTFEDFSARFPLLPASLGGGEPDNPVPVVVLSDSLWQRRVGGDEGLLGTDVVLNNRNYTGVVFGLAPALRATNPDLASVLEDQAAGFGRIRRFGLRNGLVVVQVTLSIVLLVSAGLFLRSLQNASSINRG